MQNARYTALCLTLLFLIAPMMPLATANSSEEVDKIESPMPAESFANPP